MTPIEWLMSGDTGMSSKTILSVMENTPLPHGASVPYDPSDFGRCHRLLAAFPLYRLRLPQVAEKYPAWVGLVRKWDELTKLYEEELPSGRCPKLYARMQELRREGMPADGWTEIRNGWTKQTIHSHETTKESP
jgi:hypothetical protein